MTGSAVHAPQSIVEQSAGYPAWDGEASPRSRALFWDTIAEFFITLGERSALMTNSLHVSKRSSVPLAQFRTKHAGCPRPLPNRTFQGFQ